MESRWSDSAARDVVQRYGEQGVAADVAYRVYGARLLGQDPGLILPDGGGASVKTRVKDPEGETVAVICVEASGIDLAGLAPDGLSALRLEPLRALQSQPGVSDDDLAGLLQQSRLDPAAPEPSAQALLHAFLPPRYVDHTHANAVLALSDQPNGMELCREVFGGRVGIVPYVVPGVALAQAAAAVFEENPAVEGLILSKHGVVSFGDDARQSYERMIALATMAERRLKKGRRKAFTPVELPRRLARPSQVAPVLRGLLSRPTQAQDPGKGFILTYRSGEAVRDFVNGIELARYGRSGPVTPSHIVRTKAWPVVLPAPEAGRIAAFASAARHALDDYLGEYRDYWARNRERAPALAAPRDPLPRVLLVRGLGIFAAGASAAAARSAADAAEAAVEVITGAESLGRFEGIGEADVFDFESRSFWQSGSGTEVDKPLIGHVVVIAGGAGSVGRAVARAFRDEGAEIALLDLDEARMVPIAGSVSGLAVRCDVTREDSLHAAFDQIVETFGGVDIVVSLVADAAQSRIGEAADDLLLEAFDVNFFAHQRIARTALAILAQQATGGTLLFKANAGADIPDKGSGPSVLPGAATLALAQQYAVDHGADGIRAHAVNADRVGDGIAADNAAFGATGGARSRDNLLRREAEAAEVARAFVDLALADAAAVAAVDGGASAAVLS